MKLTQDSINNINIFENLTRAKVKDCISDNGKLIFFVEEGNVKIALGKNNSNILRLSKLLKKEIKIVAFSNNVCKFVSNLIYPNKADIKLDRKIIKIIVNDRYTKGKILGRGKENLIKINSIIKNYFDIEEVEVV